MKRIVTRSTVEHVASSARLSLTEKELRQAEKDLNEILAAFRILDKAPVKKVEPSFHPIQMEDVMREDAVEEGFLPEQALGNTPHKERNYFKGPKAV